MLAYSPRWSRNQLVIPHVSRAPAVLSAHPDMPMMGRYFSENQWARFSPVPPAEEMLEWAPTSEQSWVAHCVFEGLNRNSKRLARSLCETGLSNGLQEGALRILSCRGGETLWAVTLYATSIGMENAQELIDTALEECPTDGPELGGWNNHVALLGGLSTLPPCIESEKLRLVIPKIVRYISSSASLDRILIDIQEKLDNSALVRRAIQGATMNFYEWRWTSPGAEEININFASKGSAVTWLCNVFAPGQGDKSTVRAKLSPLRDQVRSAQIMLLDKHQEVIAPGIIIDLIDAIIAGKTPSASPQKIFG